MLTNERIERFKMEATDLHRRAGSPARDRQLQAVGLGLVAIGIMLGFVAYSGSLGANDTRDILSYIVLAVAGLGVTVGGAAIFLRYSLGRFLRLFLLRQLYEGQSHLDQVVEAINRR